MFPPPLTRAHSQFYAEGGEVDASPAEAPAPSDAAADEHRQVGGDATVMKTEGYYYSAASAVSQSERQLSVNLAKKKFGDHADPATVPAAAAAPSVGTDGGRAAAEGHHVGGAGGY